MTSAPKTPTMKLRFSPTSPYVRKVLACAIATGQRQAIALVPTNPMDGASGLRADNPLEKVPALVLEDGTTLYDSRVICEYLDARAGAAGGLFPPPGPARWSALRRQALADGILDAAVLRMYERRRPEGLQLPAWDARQQGKVQRAVAAFEAEADGFAGLDIGLLALACALGYLDFRFADEGWRDSCPRLSAWYDGAAKTPALAETAPREAG